MSRLSKESYREWIAETFTNREAVVLTVNFKQRTEGQYLSASVAEDTLRRFYRGLCRKAYGSRAASHPERPEKLKFVAVSEGTSSRHRSETQLHYHGIVEVPEHFSIDAWKALCQEQWTALKWADPHSNKFVPYRTPGFIGYMLKNHTKADWEASIDMATLNLGPSSDHDRRRPETLNFYKP